MLGDFEAFDTTDIISPGSTTYNPVLKIILLLIQIFLWEISCFASCKDVTKHARYKIQSNLFFKSTEKINTILAF